MAYSSILTIEELNTQNNTSSRVVTLQGSTLPLMGSAWSGANTLVTTWYPGNPDEATQQNLGPTELPSKWNGDWRRTMMLRSPAVFADDTGATTQLTAPDDLATVLEDIFRTGGRLRVTWSVTSDGGPSGENIIGNNATSLTTTGQKQTDGIQVRKVREGRAKSWDFKYTRAQDLEWEIEFAWQSRGVRMQKVTATRASSLTANTSIMQNNLAVMQQGINAAFGGKFNPNVLTLGKLQQLANYPVNLVNSVGGSISSISNDVTQLVTIAKTAANAPQQVVQRALAISKTTVTQANGFADTLSQVPPELMTSRHVGTAVLSSAIFFATTIDNARSLSMATQDFSRNLIESQKATNTALTGAQPVTRLASGAAILSIYLAVQGDTPQRLSQRFYGNPDHAVDILDANNLPWYQTEFAVGQVLVIPALTSSTTATA